MFYNLNQGFIWTKFKLKERICDFFENESGISGIVAAVILLLIAVILAAVFWDNVKSLVDGWWETIMDESKGIGK